MSSDVYDGFDSYDDMQAARKGTMPVDIPAMRERLVAKGQHMAAQELIAQYGMSSAAAIASRVLSMAESDRLRKKREAIKRGEYVEEMGD